MSRRKKGRLVETHEQYEGRGGTGRRKFTRWDIRREDSEVKLDSGASPNFVLYEDGTRFNNGGSFKEMRRRVNNRAGGNWTPSKFMGNEDDLQGYSTVEFKDGTRGGGSWQTLFLCVFVLVVLALVAWVVAWWLGYPVPFGP